MSDDRVEAACIFVVGDDSSVHEIVRDMSRDLHVELQTFRTAEEFLKSYQPQRGGCVVAQFRLRGMNGLQLQQELVKRQCSIPICFVARDPETRMTVSAMKLGALTVLEEPVSQQELWDSVRTALARDASTREQEARQLEIRQRFNNLTPRERAVLTMVINGIANKTIAQQLDISIRTVEACRHRIFQKTQSNSVAELVILAVEIQWDFNGLRSADEQ